MIAIPAPTAAIFQSTTIPTSSVAMPTANPTGQRLGPGRCGFSSPAGVSTLSCLLDSSLSAENKQCRGGAGRLLRHLRGRQPVLLPPAVDEGLHLVAHLDP